MPIAAPNLDDRDFADLVGEAHQLVQQRCPTWTDLTPGDPGVVLIEVFAHLTDVMLYRLNRIPDRAYIEFLRLMGVRLTPPGAASVTLELSTERPAPAPVEIPRGTRVTSGQPLPGLEPPVFVTADAVTIQAGDTSASVTAYECELVEAERAGLGTGLPGQSFVIQRPPVVAPTGDPRDIMVAVETDPSEIDGQTTAIAHEGKVYRVWSEVEGFATSAPGDPAYVVDRMEGIVTFAPAARMSAVAGGLADTVRTLAAVPGAGREIRTWYRRGGGPKGNVPARTLTVLKDPVPGVAVTNPEAAAGGRLAETLENALVRGPQELHSLSRVVTARDYELTATGFGAVARARAVARASLWSYAPPGQVEVALVPDLPDEERPGGRVTVAALAARQTDDALAQVGQLLEERRPLGTGCRVTWCRYKTVTVRARLHIGREEDVDRVRERVASALHRVINPLPAAPGVRARAFGQPLRVSDVYSVVQHEPGVRYVDSVRLELEDAPDHDVSALAADPTQPHLWYAASGPVLFTSQNDGAGWEVATRFDGERVTAIRPHPAVAGLVAAATIRPDLGACVHVSADCGERWRRVAEIADAAVRGLAWVGRDGDQLLLIATDHGLYELSMQPGSTPVPLLVDPANPARGLHAVTAQVVRGVSYVAVAAQDEAGVFVSHAAGRTGTFRWIGLTGADVRVLGIQVEGPRGFLWAGLTLQHPTDPGPGCRSWELGTEDPAEGWSTHRNGWDGGSCTGLAFAGAAILASSHHGGVLWLAERDDAARWRGPDVNSGLPLRDAGRFDRVSTLAAAPDGDVVIGGGGRGLAVTRDGGTTYTTCRRVVTSDDVTLPATWLLCSGDHQIEVVRE